ncbi:MAG: GNAT family N-acetyltransferase [Pseudomonadota bacterium]
MLIYEFARQKGAKVNLTFGLPMEGPDLRGVRNLSAYLRALTYSLASMPNISLPRIIAPVVVEVPRVEDLLPEIDQLVAKGEGSFLLQDGKYQVFVAGAAEIPNILQEIGRLRGIAFLNVGEGSGGIDIDGYDAWYEHLFIWDKEANKIVGAYRLGKIDEILRDHGEKGVYSAAFFKYNGLLQRKYLDAIELGRSFVALEYQKAHKPLFLLLKGISSYMAFDPRYHFLIGTVSMSNVYTDTFKLLDQSFWERYRGSPDGAGIVALNPPRYVTPLLPPELDALLSIGDNLDLLNEMGKMIEPDGKGMPVLFRQYLNLDARFLKFSFDREFNCVDGLIEVDVAELPRPKMAKFFDPKSLENFMRYRTPK